MEASVLMTETEPHFPSLMQTARLTTAARRDTFLKKKARFKEQCDWSNRVHYNSTKHYKRKWSLGKELTQEMNGDGSSI